MTPQRFDTPEELRAYRESIWAKNTYVFGGFRFLWVTGQAWVGDIECPRLTEIEADVLHALIKSWPMPLTPIQLLNSLSVETATAPEDMKVWIRRIRRRVGVPGIIVTAPGWGYSFNPEALRGRA
jgi:DNA-binding response OmpR family regulator